MNANREQFDAWLRRVCGDLAPVSLVRRSNRIECLGGPIDGMLAEIASSAFPCSADALTAPAFRIHVNANGGRVEFEHRYLAQPDGSFAYAGVHRKPA